MFSKITKIKEAEEKNQFRITGEGLLGYGRCGLGACTINNYFANGDLNVMPSIL